MKAKRKLQTAMILVLFCISLVFGVAVTVDAKTVALTSTGERVAIAGDAPEIHAFLILNADEVMHKSYEVSERKIKQFLSPIGVKPDVWTATDAKAYTGEDILNWIKNRNVKTRDTIFVYYIGTGYMDLDNKQYLTVSGNLAIPGKSSSGALPRSALIEVLSKKDCRLKMLITDSSSLGGQKLRTPNSPQFRPKRFEEKNDEEKKLYLEDLFYKHKGLLDIAGSSPGQTGFANAHTGSFFTDILTSSIDYQVDRNGDKFHSWKEVFDFAQSETEKGFMRIREWRLSAEDILMQQESLTPFQYSLPTPTFRE